MLTQSISKKLYWLPHLLTAGNLFCGAIASVYVLSEHRLDLAFGLMALALILDVFDGLVARLLGVAGDFGKQLDSLADVVSFGLLPSFMAMELLSRSGDPSFSGHGAGRFIALILAVFAALRLAKFNIDPGQKTHFTGLPTPSMAAFFGSWAMAVESGSRSSWALNPIAIVVACVLMSALMVAPIPLFSLKPKDGKLSPLLYVCGAIGLGAAFFAGWWSLALVVLSYVLLSIGFFRPGREGLPST